MLEIVDYRIEFREFFDVLIEIKKRYYV